MAKQLPLIRAAGASAELLTSPGNAILVGGQAIALWVVALGVPIPPALEAGVTVDVDYLGTKQDAREHVDFLRASLQGGKLRCEVRFPRPFENTPNSAKITIYDDDQVAAEIDYLSSIIGYAGQDEEKLRSRAIAVDWAGINGSVLQVMHPFDCLRSRIFNLYELPSKRGVFSVAQCHLALSVLRAYIEHAIQSGALHRQLLFPLVEQVIELTTSRPGVDAFHKFNLDIMEALPIIPFYENFHERRLPQALQYIERRRYGRRKGRVPS